MKARFVISIASTLTCAVAMAGVLIQGRHVGNLRDERQRLIAKKESTARNSPAVPAHNGRNRQPTTYRPSLELLRLRGQVAQLMARQRELSAVASENKHLRDQFANQSTNVVRLPPGYLRKTQAKMVGLHTPEDTLQTFLWAIQNRDAKKLVEALSPEAAERFKNRFAREESVEEWFEENALIPGFRILERQPQLDGSVRLKVEMIPGQPDGDEIQLRLVDGEWKLDFF